MLVRCGVPAEAARLIEQGLVRGGFIGAGRNMKTIIQLVMAKMLWGEFMYYGYWRDMSPACEEQERGSETFAIYATSALFWLLFIPMLHLLLNTAVYGIASKKTDSQYGKPLDVAKGGMSIYFLSKVVHLNRY